MKRTKLIGTLSIASLNYLPRLFKEGLDIVRINTAHQTLPEAESILKHVRRVSDRLPLLIDTKGPELRTAKMQPLHVKQGQTVVFSDSPGAVNLNHKGFLKLVPKGSTVFIDDGAIELTVVSRTQKGLVCRARGSGTICGKKSVNVPGIRNPLPAVSKQDREFIAFALKHDITFIAHSFVRSKHDVLAVKNLLGKSKIRLIAKIENSEGVEHIDEILDHVYGIMIARGDLGMELPQEKLPGIQKALIKKCIERKKPVIVATQMLHSMIGNPRPTRAEVSDVANAIYDGADALMLSGETAIGRYPVAAVATMRGIAAEVEMAVQSDVRPIREDVPAFLAKAAIEAANLLRAKAIIADTLTGRTALYLSACRGRQPVFAMCYDQRTQLELALSYGVFPFQAAPVKGADEFVRNSAKLLIDKKMLKRADLVVVIAGSFGPAKGASFIEIAPLRHLAEKG
jgi:pyruvate kinase